MDLLFTTGSTTSLFPAVLVGTSLIFLLLAALWECSNTTLLVTANVRQSGSPKKVSVMGYLACQEMKAERGASGWILTTTLCDNSRRFRVFASRVFVCRHFPVTAEWVKPLKIGDKLLCRLKTIQALYSHLLLSHTDAEERRKNRHQSDWGLNHWSKTHHVDMLSNSIPTYWFWTLLLNLN